MITSNFSINNSFRSSNNNDQVAKKFSKKFEKIFTELKRDVENNKKTINVLNKKFKFNFQIKDLKRFKRYNTLAIIGMGGSILGTEAIYNFFKKKIKKKVYFFNDLNENNILNFKKKEKLQNVLFIIISKSGNTVETLSNIFTINIIKKNPKNVIIISERKNNYLFLLSKNYNIFYIEHKDYIGGRYSVLSEVGIVPAYLMGINIIKLRSKILDCFKKKNRNFLKKNSLTIAKFIISKKFNNLIFLNYFPELEKFLYWCQQLIAESLGKKGKGFLPLISSVPKDHHSLLQLFLDGPRDKLYNIFSFEGKSKVKINVRNSLVTKSFLHKKKISTVKIAQKNSLIRAFKLKNIPFREFKIKSVNEEVLGELFALFIVETIIIGKLTGINPYDQPAVEKVKVYTKQFLS